MATVILLVAFLMVLLSGLSSGLIERNVSWIKLMKATHIAFELDNIPSYTNSFVDKEMWEAWAKVPGVSAMTPTGITTFNARNSNGTALTVALMGVVAVGQAKGIQQKLYSDLDGLTFTYNEKGMSNHPGFAEWVKDAVNRSLAASS